MATVKVEGFHCIDETGRFETGSNEIVFCFAAFGINDYQQYDEFRRFETRLNTGVDSGEDQWFDEPILVTVDEDDGAHPLTRLEIHVAAYEIEGRGTTSTLARRLYERWRTALAEELYPNRPTTVVDFSDRFGSGADGTAEAVAASGDHDLIMVDAWRLDIRDPFETTSGAPGVGQSNGLYIGFPIGGVHRSSGGVQRFDSDPGRRTDRRTYVSTDASSTFRFDTHYYP